MIHGLQYGQKHETILWAVQQEISVLSDP